MMHHSKRRFVPFVRQLRVRPYLPSCAYHMIFQCRRTGATIDLEKILRPRSPQTPGILPTGWRQHAPFAVDWIRSSFGYGVSTEALHRVLERKEIYEMDFPGGFEPHQAYDGFTSKVGERYECGLCKEGNITRRKKRRMPRGISAYPISV